MKVTDMRAGAETQKRGAHGRRLTRARPLCFVSFALRRAVICLIIGFFICACFALLPSARAGATPDVDAAIEAALYTHVEFFGARALVPYPTAAARNRLARVREQFPRAPGVYRRLAELDEQLGRADEAAAELDTYARLQPRQPRALSVVADFQHRRARFDEEAATLARLIPLTTPRRRLAVLTRLQTLARAHRLEAYLAPAFYEALIRQDPAYFALVRRYLDQLAADKNYDAALAALGQFKRFYPAHARELLRREVALLEAAGRAPEAEQVYHASFDPFWPDGLSADYYAFLSRHERLRLYGHELRARLRRDPADYDAAVRLTRFAEYTGYQQDNGVFLKLEAARAARGVAWQAEELATVARLLIRRGDSQHATRFLYTLAGRGELRPGSPTRARILYQLFELLSDAGNERLPLTRGDLRFYSDIARVDARPGLLGGVLSLVFADANVGAEFAGAQTRAVGHFNRAAAYRVFEAYRAENPTAPELAQMYLDLVRLALATADTDRAALMLDEFAARYPDAARYPEVALKLADAYLAAGKPEEERALCRRILDHVAAHHEATNRPLLHAPPTPTDGSPEVDDDNPATTNDAAAAPANEAQGSGGNESDADENEADEADEAAAASSAPSTSARRIAPDEEPTDVPPPTYPDAPPASNRGIDIPDAETTAPTYYRRVTDGKDFLSGVDAQHLSREDEAATVGGGDADDRRHASQLGYAAVLDRCVASLARERRTTDILALYADEIKKHPRESGLYERMLQWLGQTNLVAEQLRIYQQAAREFPGAVWRDRLARWYLRRARKEEFARYSRELLESLPDDDAQRYLANFVGPDVASEAASFDAQLYLGLYRLAHERFPHDLRFVTGLLKFHAAHAQWDEWSTLASTYAFASSDIRQQLLAHLAREGQLRARLQQSRRLCADGAARELALAQPDASLALLPYKLFRADAAAWLADYEDALEAYRELNRLYPHTPEFAAALIRLTRSFGQHDRRALEEAAAVSRDEAEAAPADAAERTRAGELQAELGDYARARAEWDQLPRALGLGTPASYLETATVFWDYYQYDDALRTLGELRRAQHDDTLYAFQTGALYEARHQTQTALGEYVKALDENAPDHYAARRRLLRLYPRPGIATGLRRAYAQAAHARAARRADVAPLTLGYAGLLAEAKQWPEASSLLRRAVESSGPPQFLLRARDLFVEAEDVAGERFALTRLAAHAPGARLAISYRLQLAASYLTHGQRGEAAQAVGALVRDYPTNYGVLNEAADIYWRAGLRADSLRILEAGRRRGLGRFHYSFARRLAARLAEENQTARAALVLRELHAENPGDTGVFHELAGLYVRAHDRRALAEVFRATLAATQAQDADLVDMRYQVAELRAQMIEAFTRLRDYHAAVEQQIEIINRNPEDPERLDRALRYVARYGGGDELENYYRQLARTAYKNYRWPVVLARIAGARRDWPTAAARYRDALAEQPEMVELFDGLADATAHAGDLDASIAARRRATELTNDDPAYVTRLAAALDTAGRADEARAVRAKLPPEVAPAGSRQTSASRFAEAAARTQEHARSVALYREAWDNFARAPERHPLQAAEVNGYVRALRDEEPLDRIAQRLFDVRARLQQDAARPGNADAGQSRAQLSVLDGALPEAVGAIAFERATGDELRALERQLRAQVDDALAATDAGVRRAGTLALVRNLARRAGLGALEDYALTRQLEAARRAGGATLHYECLRALINLYAERGDEARAVALLRDERAHDPAPASFPYARMLAEHARLTNDQAVEREALRAYYEETRATSPPPLPVSSDPPLVNAAAAWAKEVIKQLDARALRSSSDELHERYFAALLAAGAVGRAELFDCARAVHPSHLQLINFLIARGERELAHAAIDSAPLSLAWKRARHAAASQFFGEADARAASNFTAALYYRSIGELVGHRVDAEAELDGDDWFTFAQSYGAWLHASNEPSRRALGFAFLPARVENRPHDPDAQAQLGRWYLDHAEPQRALAHLRLALDAYPDNSQLLADTGAAAFAVGNRTAAVALWQRLLGGDDEQHATPDACLLYLRTLAGRGLAAEARARLVPLVIAHLRYVRDGEMRDTSTPYEFGDLKPLVRALAASFGHDDAGRTRYFIHLCATSLHDAELPAMLIEEALIERGERGAFYESLIKSSPAPSRYDEDYDYTTQLRARWNRDDAEEAVDHDGGDSGGTVHEPTGARIKWQQAYLSFLIERRDARRAERLLGEIEQSLARRYARPAWLRLARARLDLRAGRTATALASLRRLVGVETRTDLARVQPPRIERVNDAVSLLAAEHLPDEARALLVAAHTRALALEDFAPQHFVALARWRFGGGDTEGGLKLLQTMIEVSDAETRPAAAAALLASVWVAAYVVPGTLPEPTDTPPVNEGQSNDALHAAADTAAEFGHFAWAAGVREQLLRRAPTDEINRLELARLRAADGERARAGDDLAALIADRLATRRVRWQAVWLMPEIIGTDGAQWARVTEHVRGASSSSSPDTEMLAALEAQRLVAAGQLGDALKMAAELARLNPNPAARYFYALLAVRAQRPNEARDAFINALAADHDLAAWQAFAWSEDPPRVQLVRLAAALDQPRLALQFAESEAELNAPVRSEGRLMHSDASADDDDKNPDDDPDIAADTGAATTDKGDASSAENRREADVAVNGDGQDEPTDAAAGTDVNALLTHDAAANFHALAVRQSERAGHWRVALLQTLASCAEQIGEAKRALAFLRRASMLSVEATTRRDLAVRVKHLKSELRAQRLSSAAAPAGKLIVDRRLVVAATPAGAGQ